VKEISAGNNGNEMAAWQSVKRPKKAEENNQ
jgi:hypothetical protein